MPSSGAQSDASGSSQRGREVRRCPGLGRHAHGHTTCKRPELDPLRDCRESSLTASRFPRWQAGVPSSGARGEGSSSSPLPIGACVALHGLTQDSLNGRTGRAVAWDSVRGRMAVDLDGSAVDIDGSLFGRVNVKPIHVKVVQVLEDDTLACPECGDDTAPEEDYFDPDMPCLGHDSAAARPPAARRRTTWLGSPVCSGGCRDPMCHSSSTSIGGLPRWAHSGGTRGDSGGRQGDGGDDDKKNASSKMLTISRADAQAVLQRTAEEATLAGMQMGAELAGKELAAKHAAEMEAQLLMKDAEQAAAVKRAVASGQAELTTLATILTTEISEMDDLISDVTAAKEDVQRVLEARISSLMQQLGGSNWLTARTSLAAAKEQVKSLKAQSEADRVKLKELNDLLAVGPRLREKGETLRSQLSSQASVRGALLSDELAAETPSCAPFALLPAATPPPPSRPPPPEFPGCRRQPGRHRCLGPVASRRRAARRSHAAMRMARRR